MLTRYQYKLKIELKNFKCKNKKNKCIFNGVKFAKPSGREIV